MIVDSVVLGRISSKWQGQMFKSKWANLIAKWCLGYYRKYQEAPMVQIEGLYESWAESANDKETVSLVSKFLGSLSEEYESLKDESNSSYIIDVAGRYFNQVKIEHLLQLTQGSIDEGKVDKAVDHIASYNQIEMGVGKGIDILHDVEAIKEAFADKKEPLIQYPGDLGEFFGDSLERDGFVAFMGPEKRGKSFWLLDIAYRAMLARKKVAFFEVGDMSQNQIMRRLMVRVARRPLCAGKIYVPTDMSFDDTNEIDTSSKRESYKDKLSWRDARKACQRLMRKKVKSKDSYFRLSCHPNSTLNVKVLKAIIQSWERDGWTPDVVVIDYADILNMDYAALEGRDRINETWKQLRSLSQVFHCLVVTATQTDAASYKTPTLTMSHFSEDKRKLSHVTGMIGINALREEKDEGVMRLNWVALRERRFSESACVYVAGCLEIANPAMYSYFPKVRKHSKRKVE